MPDYRNSKTRHGDFDRILFSRGVVDGHCEMISTPQVQRFKDCDPINDDFKRVGVSKGIY
jgi:hypothetical protein